MNEKTTNTTPTETPTASAKKPTLFGRIFQKLDSSMKQKADEKSQESCCGGSDDKGNKCC